MNYSTNKFGPIWFESLIHDTVVVEEEQTMPWLKKFSVKSAPLWQFAHETDNFWDDPKKFTEAILGQPWITSEIQPYQRRAIEAIQPRKQQMQQYQVGCDISKEPDSTGAILMCSSGTSIDAALKNIKPGQMIIIDESASMPEVSKELLKKLEEIRDGKAAENDSGQTI